MEKNKISWTMEKHILWAFVIMVCVIFITLTIMAVSEANAESSKPNTTTTELRKIELLNECFRDCMEFDKDYEYPLFERNTPASYLQKAKACANICKSLHSCNSPLINLK